MVSHRPKSSIASQIVLNELYDEEYEIVPQNDLKRPLSIIALHSTEETPSNSLTQRTMEEFINNDIGKYFNISFLDYISFPTYVHKMMIQIALNKAKKLTNVADAFKDEFEKY